MAHTAGKQSPTNDSDGLGVDPDLAVSHCKEDPLPHFEAGELWGEVNLVPSHHGGCVQHLGVNGGSQVARRTDGHGLAPESAYQSVWRMRAENNPDSGHLLSIWWSRRTRPMELRQRWPIGQLEIASKLTLTYRPFRHRECSIDAQQEFIQLTCTTGFYLVDRQNRPWRSDLYS